MNHYKAVRDDHFLTQLAAVAKAYGPYSRVVWHDPYEPPTSTIEPTFVQRTTPAVDMIPALVDRVKDQANDIRALLAILGAARASLSDFQYPVEDLRKSRERSRGVMALLDVACASLHFHGRVHNAEQTAHRARELTAGRNVQEQRDRHDHGLGD